MRRITLLSLLVFAAWVVPPGAQQLADPTTAPLTLRASTPGALVWFAAALMVTVWAWATAGYELARWLQTGRGRARPLLWLLLALAICWLLIPLLDAADDPFRPPLMTLRLADEQLGLWLLICGLVSPVVLLSIGWRWQRLRGQTAQAQHIQALVNAQLDEGVALIDRKQRLVWANDAARKQLLVKGERLDSGLLPILKRAHDTQRISAQSVTMGERRIHVQALPLADGLTSVITRPQDSDTSQTQFYERFMRRIVHDMRNPLAAIIAHASNLQTAPLHEYEGTRRAAATIENEAQRLTRLVDSILFDARLTYMPVVLERLDLLDILEEVFYQHDERAENEQKTLEIETPPDPMPLEGDRDLLVRAISNLVDNSLKYSGRGAKVRIVSERTPQHYLIKIVDDGEGIPPEFLPDRIFEPLVRVKPREGASGTGLGLSIVRKIAQMHGGAINVESALGRGTTMTVVLPRPAA
jgi:signal transduction histidine kinase